METFTVNQFVDKNCINVKGILLVGIMSDCNRHSFGIIAVVLYIGRYSLRQPIVTAFEFDPRLYIIIVLTIGK